MLSDPWGQVYLEAMKSRAIVVSLNHRALPELTDEGRNAFLIERAAPACLAEAVLAAYATPQDSLEDMAAAAQKVALEQHGWESVADRILSRIGRSEEHTSELQSLMRISYAVFCLKKKK